MNLNHWHDERLVELKMREIEREIEQARLLREAGLASGPNWLSRIAAFLQNLAKAHSRKSLQEQQPISRQPYRSVSDKLA